MFVVFSSHFLFAGLQTNKELANDRIREQTGDFRNGYAQQFKILFALL